MSQNNLFEGKNDGKELFAAEQLWLWNRVHDTLKKTRVVLEAIESSALLGTFEELFAVTSLDMLMGRLGQTEVVGKVFRSLFNDEEWSELKASAECVSCVNFEKLRTLRLKRQQRCLREMHVVAIDLTFDGDEDQTALANSCARSFQSLWALIGMDSCEKQLNRVTLSDPINFVSLEVENTKVSEKEETRQKKSTTTTRKKKKEKKVGNHLKKRERNNDVEEGSKLGKNARKNEEEEEEESNEAILGNMIMYHGEEDVGAKIGVAELEVDKIVAMLKEREREPAGLALLVGRVNVPNPTLATAAEGASLLSDLPRLTRYLHCGKDSGDDQQSEVERWGSLLRWWRLVDRCFAVCSIFSCLRERRKGRGKKIQDRYTSEAKRIGGRVYSFAQASRFDRIGKFLLKFPRFIYQTQFVTQADWFQPTGNNRRPFLDVVEQILNGDQLAFWGNMNYSVSLDDPHTAGGVEDNDKMLFGVGEMLMGEFDLSNDMNVGIEQNCDSCNKDNDQLWIFCDHVLSSVTSMAEEKVFLLKE